MRGIRTEDVLSCILCTAPGQELYSGLKDSSVRHEGTFSIKRCAHCGLLWLSPRPVQEDMPRFYEGYYTHAQPSQKNGQPGPRLLGGLRDSLRESILCGYYGYRHLHAGHKWCILGGPLGRLTFMRLRATNESKELLPHYKENGHLIEIGCGQGDFLCRMKQLGWEVMGVEIDTEAARIAEAKGLEIHTKPLHQLALPGDSVDCITMNHVIEHVYDPIALIGECHRILKRCGAIIMYAPNSSSLGRVLFGGSWRAFDPPRHLYSFSYSSMKLLLEKSGFSKVTIKTTTRLAKGIYDASMMSKKSIRLDGQEAPEQKGRDWFALKERLYCALGLNRGEEIFVKAVK